MASPRAINPLERLILLSADEEGRVPFFQWQGMAVEGNLKALTLMEKTGYLRREPGEKFCRAFHLTEVGRKLREAIRARREKMRAGARGAQGARASGRRLADEYEL